jgi:hypothetical protein
MKILDVFLKVKTENRNIFQIILWWELRRILYNAIVLIAGIISINIMLIVSKGKVELQPGEDFIEPFMIIFFGFVCNMCYTLGWFTEICKKKSLTYGPKMFKRGLYFTLFWVFLPSIIWIILWIK